MKITIPPVTNKLHRFTQGGTQILILAEKVIYFSCQGWVEEASDSKVNGDYDNEVDKLIAQTNEGEWTRREINYDHAARRTCVVGVEMYWAPRQEVWKVDINLWGHSDEWTLYFATKSEAVEVRDKILNWMIS